MTPISNKSTCTTIVSASCIKWPYNVDLSVISLCKEDSMVDVVYKLNNALAEINNTLDVSKLTLDCLDDCELGCGLECNENLTINNVLDCIIKSHCTLKDQVGTLGSGTIFGDIDLSCTTEWSITTPALETNYTDEDLINYILALICENYNRTKNDDVIIKINSLEDRINVLEASIDQSNDTGDQVFSAGCAGFWTGSKTTSEVVALLSARLAALEKASLSTTRGTDIFSCNAAALVSTSANQTTIVSQLQTWGLSTTNIDLNPETLEDKLVNLFEINKLLTTRMLQYDTVLDCCRISCKDIDRNLYVSRTTTGYTVTLTFDGSATVPTYVEDCGTNLDLNVTDGNGLSVTLSVPLTGAGSIDGGYTIAKNDNRISNIDFTTAVKFELSGCFVINNTDESQSIECFLCEAATLPGATVLTADDCAVCTYTLALSAGSNYDVEVQYLLSGETIAEVMTVTTDTFTLPSSATIVSIINNDTATTLTVTGDPDTCQVGAGVVKNTSCYSFVIPNSLNDRTGVAFSTFNAKLFDWSMSELDGVALPMWDGVNENTVYGTAYDPTYGIAASGGTAFLDYQDVTDPNSHKATESITCDRAYVLSQNLVDLQTTINDTLEAGGSSARVTLITRRMYEGPTNTTADDGDEYGRTTLIVTAPSGKDFFLKMSSTVGIADDVYIKGVEGNCNCADMITG